MLRIPSAQSLKGRRRVVKSLKERLQARLRVSAAEVGDLNHAQHAELAVVMVANSAEHLDLVLGQAAQMANTVKDATLMDRKLEVIPFGSFAGSVGEAGGGEAIGEFATPFTIEPLKRRGRGER